MSESIRRNIGWNLAGIVVPMLAGVLVVPVLVSRLGIERFGVVSIAWMLVGYFGVLDLGLGRALTRAVAELRGRRLPASTQAAVAYRATLIMFGIGVSWMLLLAALSGWLAYGGLSVPAPLQQETCNGLRWLAVSVPCVLFSNARLALLEGQQRFHLANAIKIPMGIMTMLAPMLVSLWAPRLDAVLGAIALVRMAAAGFLGILRPWPPEVTRDASVDERDMRDLFRFGGWLTVSNLVGPLITYFDRFYLAAVISTAAVTLYTVPYDVLVRLTAFPIALLAVLFPAMSELGATDPRRLGALVRKTFQLLLAGWWPLLAAAVLVAPEALRVWVGPAFLGDSLQVWKWLAVGIFFNGCAFLPYTLIQSAGRSDVTAKFHLLELPIYLVLLVTAVKREGIVGAAMAWTLRSALDAILLYGTAAFMNKRLSRQLWEALAAVSAAGLVLWALTALDSREARLVLTAIAVTLGPIASWIVFSRFRSLGPA